jgi:hypothetical protein
MIHIQRVHVVQGSLGNMDETRDIPAQIQQRVHLHGGFGAPEMCPWEQRQAQIDRCRIQCINRVVQLSQQAFTRIKPSCLCDQLLSELRVNAPVSNHLTLWAVVMAVNSL